MYNKHDPTRMMNSNTFTVVFHSNIDRIITLLSDKTLLATKMGGRLVSGIKSA